MPYTFKIDHLNIHESYFKGKVEFRGDDYTINIQDERRGKVLKLPFALEKKKKVLVRFSGPNDIAVEYFLPFEGESEWVEVDSCLLYTSPSPRDLSTSRMPSSA